MRVRFAATSRREFCCFLLLIDSADAIIHPSIEESFGLAPAEGLARNLKLFATHACGVIDIATGVEAAETFAPDDWPALDRAIAAWLTAGAPRPTTAAATMRARYHPSVVAAAHVEIYRELIRATTAACAR